MARKARLSEDQYVEGILNGNRIILSQAITLIESNLPEDSDLSARVLEKILPYTGNSIRVGITGVPGVGKSTFIESFGTDLINQGKKLAVLAIDPSSRKTGGSILGDKTRMESLSVNPKAYIRPTPSGHTLGGVANKTRETMLCCEAAGFDVILIETVGVGQSEIAVKDMTDFFLLLMLAGAGDELQGIKKGIMEMADALVINKADGDNLKKAKKAAAEYQNALHLFPASYPFWYPKVSTCSALENKGMLEVWQMIESFVQLSKEEGFFDSNRGDQNLKWFQSRVEDQLKQRFYMNEQIESILAEKQEMVKEGKLAPRKLATEMIDLFLGGK